MLEKRLALAVACAALLCASAPGAKTLVFVHDRGTEDRVFAYRVLKTGAIKPVKGSPFASGDGGGQCGGMCQTMAYSDRRKALVTGGPSGLTVYKVAKKGKLKRVKGSPFASETTGFLGTAAVEVGKKVFVYAAEFDQDRVRAFEMDKKGRLEPHASGPLQVGDGPDGLDARGDTLVVANENDQTLSACRVEADGSLTFAGSANGGSGFAYNVRLSPAGDFAYQADAGGLLRVFSIDPDTSALATVQSGVDSLLVETSGGVSVAAGFAFAFPFQPEGPIVSRLERLGDGTLAGATPLQDGLSRVSAHALDPTESLLVVASDLDQRVLAFRVEPDGSLALVGAEPLPAERVTAVVVARR